MPFAVPITQPGKTPAYTVDDARAFVAKYPSADFNTVSGAPFTIDDVQFVTREQAEQLMRDSSLQGQVAPGDLVCFVSLTGPFTGNTIPVPYGVHKRTWHPTYLALVFDAHTGYLLSEWFHE